MMLLALIGMLGRLGLGRAWSTQEDRPGTQPASSPTLSLSISRFLIFVIAGKCRELDRALDLGALAIINHPPSCCLGDSVG